MIKMCLNLIGSQYKSISEVEQLLNNGITEQEIIEIKDNREAIEQKIRLQQSRKELFDLYC